MKTMKTCTRPSLCALILTALVSTSLAQVPGSIDTSFQVRLPDHSEARMGNIQVQPDGKILVSAELFSGKFDSESEENAARVLGPVFRLRSDGSLDDTFRNRADLGDACGFTPPLGQQLTCLGASGLVHDSRGRSVVVLSQYKSFPELPETGLVRLDASGQLDSSFVPAFPRPLEVCPAPDGKLLVPVADEELTRPFRSATKLVRLNEDGSVDATFEVRETSLPAGHSLESCLSVQPDGKVLATARDANGSSRLVRFNQDAKLDPQFKPFAGDVNLVRVLSDGRIVLDAGIVVGGNFIRRVARLLPDGTADPTFRLALNISFGGFLEVEPSGGILIANEDWRGAPYIAGPTRFHADGTLDESFRSELESQDLYVTGIARQPDGKIIVAGTRNGVAVIQRLHGNQRPYLIPSTLRRVASGGLEFQIAAPNDRMIIVEASDAVHANTWSSLKTFPAAADRPTMTFTDPDAAKVPQRFYRAVSR